MKKNNRNLPRFSFTNKRLIQSCFNCYTLTSKTFLYKCIKLNEKKYMNFTYIIAMNVKIK